MRVAAIIALALFSTPAFADKVFVCKGKDGVTVFQNTQCAVPGDTKASYSYVRQPDVPNRVMSEAQYVQQNRSRRVNAAAAKRQAKYDQLVNEAANAAAGERQDEYDQILNPRRETVTTTRSPTDFKQPERVIDQYGKSYHRPAGSHFVTDPITGKPCLAVGGTIKCDL